MHQVLRPPAEWRSDLWQFRLATIFCERARLDFRRRREAEAVFSSTAVFVADDFDVVIHALDELVVQKSQFTSYNLSFEYVFRGKIACKLAHLLKFEASHRTQVEEGANVTIIFSKIVFRFLQAEFVVMLLEIWNKRWAMDAAIFSNRPCDIRCFPLDQASRCKC